MSLINLRSVTAKPKPPPPLPTDPPGIYSLPVTDNDLAHSKKKFVKVSGAGEIVVCPDQIEFCIKITGIKSDLKECRSSIKKREDYVVAIMKRNSINANEIESNEMVSKTEIVDNADNDEFVDLRKTLGNENANNHGDIDPNMTKLPKCMYTVVKELCVTCKSISTYRQIFSICNEKLDSRVVISEPIINFSSQLLEKSTEAALAMAVKNCVKKAQNLITGQDKKNGIGASLGPIIYTIEDSLTSDNLVEFRDSDFDSLKWRQHSKRIKLQITSAYEILTDKSRKLVI